jgi:hypothetical protein
MPKPEHMQEFMQALREELKKPETPKDPRMERMTERMNTRGRKMPPSMIIMRSAHINRRKGREEEETWISFARQIYDYWLAENYPDEK